MSSYKVIYFEARGRAEVTRLTLALAEQEFEDVRYSFDEWEQHKAAMPQNQLPVMEMDGVIYLQSNAMLRCVGRAFDLYGKDNKEQTHVDVVLETVNDFINAMTKVYYEKDENETKKILADIRQNAAVKFGKSIQEILMNNNNGTGWLVGDKVTIADLAVFNMFNGSPKYFKEITDEVSNDRSDLKRHCERVANLPAIAKWVEERPKTDM